MTGTPPLSVAYLTSRYPMLSMSFVLREVVELRRLGVRIDVASINPPDRPATGLTDEERLEAGRTYCLKTDGVLGALQSLGAALRRDPRAVASGLLLALRMAGPDLRRLAMNVAYLAEALMVGRWMTERQHTHLHVHLGSQPATVGLLAKRIFGFGLSMTVHGPDEFFDVERQYLAQKVEACDFVCCISQYARSQLMRVSPVDLWDRLIVSRLGIDPAHFSHAPLSAKPRSDAFEIVCVGRLTPAKGQHRLLDAIARLKGAEMRVRLTVVGDGADRASLEKHAEALGLREEVRFTGPINHDAIRELYLAADCFCLPSFAEGIPIVLMEAMAMELPCVTTWIAGIPELIRDGIDGFLVAPSDDVALAEVLSELSGDEALRLRVGCSARERVLSAYHLGRNVAALHAVFAERIPQIRSR